MTADAHLEDYIDRIKPKAASSLLLWVICGFFLIFLLWAALTQLDRTVRGLGRVISSSQLQVVSNLEGGVVDAILVKTGQYVRAGSELVRLNRTQARAEFGSGEATLNALEVKIARLDAEVHGRSPAFPNLADKVLNQQVAIERSLYASRLADLANSSSAARARVEQARSAIEEAQASYAARIAARGPSAARAHDDQATRRARDRTGYLARPGRECGGCRDERCGGRIRFNQPPSQAALSEVVLHSPRSSRNGAARPPTISPPRGESLPREGRRSRPWLIG